MEVKLQLLKNLLNHHKQVVESYEIFNNYEQETKDLNISFTRNRENNIDEELKRARTASDRHNE